MLSVLDASDLSYVDEDLKQEIALKLLEEFILSQNSTGFNSEITYNGVSYAERVYCFFKSHML